MNDLLRMLVLTWVGLRRHIGAGLTTEPLLAPRIRPRNPHLRFQLRGMSGTA